MFALAETMYLCRTLGELLRMHSSCFCYRSNNVWFWKEQGFVSFAEMKCQKCKHFGAHNTPLPKRCLAMLFFLWLGRNCTRLGPYNCVSSENLRNKDTYGPWKWQIRSQTNKTRQKPNPSDPQISQPDLRFAANQIAKQHRNGAGPNNNNQTGFAMWYWNSSTVSLSKTCKLISYCGRSSKLLHARMTYWGGPSWWAWFWQLARLLKTELLLLVMIKHLHLIFFCSNATMAFAWSLYKILLAVLISAKEADHKVKLHVRDWRDVKNDVLCMVHWRNGRKQSKQKRKTTTKTKGGQTPNQKAETKTTTKKHNQHTNKKPAVECIETSTAHRSEKVWRWQLVYHLPSRPSVGNQKEQTNKNHKDGPSGAKAKKSQCRNPGSPQPGSRRSHCEAVQAWLAPMHIDHVDMPGEWKRGGETTVRHTEWKRSNKKQPPASQSLLMCTLAIILMFQLIESFMQIEMEIRFFVWREVLQAVFCHRCHSPTSAVARFLSATLQNLLLVL